MKGPSYKDKFALANILGPLSIGLDKCILKCILLQPFSFQTIKESPGDNLPSLFFLLHPT